MVCEQATNIGRKETIKKYYQKHKDKLLIKSRLRYQKNKNNSSFVANRKKRDADRYLKNREIMLQKGKKWRENNKEHLVEYNLKKRYGLSKSNYLQLITQQKNCCALCDKNFVKKPVVDHCHLTGKIRGLIHDKCNKLLGFAEDDVTILDSAIKYLNKYE